jgi:hypothetical protein
MELEATSRRFQELNINRNSLSSRCGSARRNGMPNIIEGIDQKVLVNLNHEFVKQVMYQAAGIADENSVRAANNQAINKAENLASRFANDKFTLT